MPKERTTSQSKAARASGKSKVPMIGNVPAATYHQQYRKRVKQEPLTRVRLAIKHLTPAQLERVETYILRMVRRPAAPPATARKGAAMAKQKQQKKGPAKKVPKRGKPQPPPGY